MNTEADSKKLKAKRDMIRSMILSNCQNGETFGVTFVKADGSIRDMNCRTGVTKHLKGGESTIKDKDYLFGVFDMAVGQYRCINLDTVQEVRINKQKVNFG